MSQIELVKTIFSSTLAFTGVLFALFCIAVTIYESAISKVQPRQKKSIQIVLVCLLVLLTICSLNSLLSFLYIQNLFPAAYKLIVTLFYVEILSPLAGAVVFVFLNF